MHLVGKTNIDDGKEDKSSNCREEALTFRRIANPAVK